MNYVPLIVVPDPDAIGPDTVVIPDLVATGLTIISASDLIAIESTNAVVLDSVEPKEQHVVTSPVTTDYNNEFRGQFVQDVVKQRYTWSSWPIFVKQKSLDHFTISK